MQDYPPAPVRHLAVKQALSLAAADMDSMQSWPLWHQGVCATAWACTRLTGVADSPRQVQRGPQQALRGCEAAAAGAQLPAQHTLACSTA